MAIPILATNLHIPPPRPKAVHRPRLLHRLNDGLRAGCKLTLISAPAGFGKTTLLSEWIHQKDEGRRLKDEIHPPSLILHPSSLILHPSRVAWLSLDEADNDPTRFLAYLVAALQTIVPALGEGLSAVLHSPQPSAEAILTLLLNDIATTPPTPQKLILVLDDYHVIDAPPIDEALIFLLEHLPSQLHLVITTREDPPFPLPRLRARGQLTELRAADLRFTPTEAAEFLNQVMDLNLSAADVAALEERTEGWIAGMQLAALSLHGRHDIPDFIRSFTGDHRYIVDYLVAEVLQQQPEPIRNFLLHTSILDRLSAPLCDTVLGKDEGGRMKVEGGRLKETNTPHPSSLILHPSSLILDHLDRTNLFIIPLDHERHWYRYHHLFAHVLQAHLRAEQPDQIATLHRRASQWFEGHGATADAIRHALLAKDFPRAADLVELTWPDIRRNRQEATMLAWLQSLPDELFPRRPLLNVAYAHVLLASGQVEGVEQRLRAAEQLLNEPTSAAMIIADNEALRRLPGDIALARAGLALARGDVPATETHAQNALDLAPEDDQLTRGGATSFLGLASWTNGELETAHQLFATGMERLKKAGNIPDTINGANTLATIRLAQGRLRQAMRTYEGALQLATVQGVPLLRGAADMHVGLSEIHRERNDLQAATQHLQISQQLGEQTGFPQNRYRWHVAMARVQQAQGELTNALDLLDEAERLYMSDFAPNVRPIPALKARLWVAQGRIEDALDWAHEQELSTSDQPSYLREFAHLTLARILLAQHKTAQAAPSLLELTSLLERLLGAAEAGQRTGSIIEILVIQSLTHQAQGDIPAALRSLERALTLAQPEGYVRIFVDEGGPMATLLKEAAKHNITPSYLRHLLAAFNQEEETTAATQALLDPLSEREMDVLRLLATDLSGPELARELMVSLATVRTHTQNIYSKLGVNNRRAAVRLAKELALF